MNIVDNADNTEITEVSKEERYTRKIEIPVYEPSDKMPRIDQIYNTEKRDSLVKRIKESNLPEELEAFLMSAAERHTVFNFSKIADFYAHSSKEIKELFEESALVIIDYDAAIKNGFIAYQKTVDEYLAALTEDWE